MLHVKTVFFLNKNIFYENTSSLIIELHLLQQCKGLYVLKLNRSHNLIKHSEVSLVYRELQLRNAWVMGWPHS